MKAALLLATVTTLGVALTVTTSVPADAQYYWRSDRDGVVIARPRPEWSPRYRYWRGDQFYGDRYAPGFVIREAPYPNTYRGGLSCEQLERYCSNGRDWACRVLDRDPNC